MNLYPYWPCLDTIFTHVSFFLTACIYVRAVIFLFRHHTVQDCKDLCILGLYWLVLRVDHALNGCRPLNPKASVFHL